MQQTMDGGELAGKKSPGDPCCFVVPLFSPALLSGVSRPVFPPRVLLSVSTSGRRLIRIHPPFYSSFSSSVVDTLYVVITTTALSWVWVLFVVILLVVFFFVFIDLLAP